MVTPIPAVCSIPSMPCMLFALVMYSSGGCHLSGHSLNTRASTKPKETKQYISDKNLKWKWLQQKIVFSLVMYSTGGCQPSGLPPIPWVRAKPFFTKLEHTPCSEKNPTNSSSDTQSLANPFSTLFLGIATSSDLHFHLFPISKFWTPKHDSSSRLWEAQIHFIVKSWMKVALNFTFYTFLCQLVFSVVLCDGQRRRLQISS